VKVLNLEEFEQIVAELKSDLQREANQWVLKRDMHQAAASLASMDSVDRLAHRVIARAFSLGEQEKPQKVKLFNRRTKKQMEEARGKVREFSSKKVG
jgi:hypothetical protein